MAEGAAFFTLFSTIGFAVLTVVVHVLLAVGVHDDAAQRQHRRQLLRFGGPLTWTFATLAFGLFALGLYWVIHCSTLGREEEAASTDR